MGNPSLRHWKCIEIYGVLILRNLSKLQLFRFIVNVITDNMPYFLNVLLRPHLPTHIYHTRTRAFRHPLIICELVRRAITHQMVLLHYQTSELYLGSSAHSAVGRFKEIY